MKRKIDEVKSIKILKARNGIALIAVLSILLILTLLLPAMFSMGEIQMKEAVKGMDTQRASYLARAITEMSVAAFKQSYTEINNAKDGGYFPSSKTDSSYTNATERMKHLYDEVNPALENLYNGNISELKSQPVYMFYKEADKQYYFAAEGSGDYTAYSNADSGYRLVGRGTCTITFDDNISYYKVDSITQIPEKIEPETDKEGNITKTAEQVYAGLKKKITDAIASNKAEEAQNLDYTVSQIQNRNVIFTADGVVNGKRQTRKCIVVLPTYPSEKQWLYFDGKAGETDASGIQKITEGCNQMNFDPAGATGLAVINYTETGIDDYKPQPLQIYSCLGNMVINSRDVKDAIYDDDGNRIPESSRKAVSNGVNGSELVLGVVPSLNTVGNDPNWNIIKGINGYASKDGIQKDNFIACSASNAIEVDVPINLMVNGLRTLRRGDWALGSMWPGENHEANVSIYKILMFQAPIIYFARNVDMMASFYTAPITRNDNARRMSSVILMAPASTPYHYYNADRGTDVKAGMVFFGEDCYVWIINHGNNGSDYSENWYEFNQTVWKKDSDFVKVKVASAGDVYYFNSEVKMVDTVRSGLFGRTTVTTERNAGFSITGYAVEVLYLNDYKELTTNASPWWEVWTKTKTALFGYYMNVSNKDHTYVRDDFKYKGNIYTDSDVSVPEIDNFYTVWES